MAEMETEYGKKLVKHNFVFKGIHKEDLETTEIQTAGGLQGIHVLYEKIIANWIVKDNPGLAALILQAGVRLYLHHLAGFEHKLREAIANQNAGIASLTSNSQV